MLFQKKKTLDKPELDLHVFKTKVELRRLQEKYQAMLEKELRVARMEKEGGAPRPANYERIKTIYYLLQTTDAAYQDLENISTTDDLNRTTNELAAVLKRVDQLANTSQRADTGGIKRGIGQMNRNERDILKEYQTQEKIVAKGLGAASKYDNELEELLGEIPAPPATQNVRETQAVVHQTMTDAELEAEMDSINRHLYGVLEDF